MSYPESVVQLERAGIDYHDAIALRRISMTLHRWHELECGDSSDYASWTVARGHKANGAFEYDDNGKPYLEVLHHRAKNGATYSPIADKERGALKRLAKIMARYPGFEAYVQGDPRGASLYILTPSQMERIREISGVLDGYYSRGIAVYK